MPVPSSFDDISETASSNSPQGSEPVGTLANDYFQAAFSFIRQIYDGVVKPLAAVDFNAQKLTNLAVGTVSSTSKDAVTGAQLAAHNKIGDIKMWHGAVANIATAQGPGWQLADGTNGTANLLDRFIVGAGFSYAPNAVGGSATQALSLANLPVHNHVVNDPGHTHAISQTPHGHTLTDPGHGHTVPFNGGTYQAGAVAFAGNANIATIANTNSSATGISLAAGLANVANVGALTGVTTANAGSGAAIDTRPPYYALCFLEYTGIGV